jgi:hypothetical protein
MLVARQIHRERGAIFLDRFVVSAKTIERAASAAPICPPHYA